MQPWAPARLLPFPARPPAGRHRRRTRSTHLPLPPTWPPARLRGRRFRGWFARSSATHPPHWQLPALWAAPGTAAGRATSSTSQAALQDAPLPRRAAQPSTACSRSLPCAHRVGALLATPRPRHPPPLPATPRPSTLSACAPRDPRALPPPSLPAPPVVARPPRATRCGGLPPRRPSLMAGGVAPAAAPASHDPPPSTRCGGGGASPPCGRPRPPPCRSGVRYCRSRRQVLVASLPPPPHLAPSAPLPYTFLMALYPLFFHPGPRHHPVPSLVRVFQTNFRLYTALEAGDVAGVATAWACIPGVVHALWLRPSAVGYDAVVAALAGEWDGCAGRAGGGAEGCGGV